MWIFPKVTPPTVRSWQLCAPCRAAWPTHAGLFHVKFNKASLHSLGELQLPKFFTRGSFHCRNVMLHTSFPNAWVLHWQFQKFRLQGVLGAFVFFFLSAAFFKNVSWESKSQNISSLADRHKGMIWGHSTQPQFSSLLLKREKNLMQERQDTKDSIF